MTPKQQRFVEEFLIDLNATQAAIRAGYSEKTAQEQSSRLLSNVMVQAAIRKAQEERSKRLQIDQDKVLKDLETVKQDAMTILENGGMRNHNAALKACELQGRHLGMFVDRTELTGRDGEPQPAHRSLLDMYADMERERLKISRESEAAVN